MAKKAKKKTGSSKKKSNNWFVKLLIIILVLAFGFFMVAKYMKPAGETKPAKAVKTEKPAKADKKAPSVKNVTVNGVWMNDNDESTLSIKDGKYSIYMTGMDRDYPFIGKYKIEGNRITFISTQDPCEGAKGIYEVSYTGKDIVLKCVEDDCSKRKKILKNDWIWLDTSYDED